MGRLKIIGLNLPPIGHNSLNAEFRYRKGEVAPHVTMRPIGTVPHCIPANIQQFHTHAEANEWLNWIAPNASRYPIPPQDAARKPIEEVLQRSDEIAEQYSQAVAEYVERKPGLSVDAAYLELTRKMGAKTLLSSLRDTYQRPRKLMIIGWEEK
jgi:hypothetical protein